MFENDICICGDSQDCPDQEKCLRAKTKKTGIYTVSNFYFYRTQENKEKCDYFLNKEFYYNNNKKL